MKLRKMKPDDLDAVLDVIAAHDEEDAEAAEEYFEEYYEEVEEDDAPDDQHFVCVDQDKIVGVGGAMEDDEEGWRIWWLGWYYVHPDYQQKGLGEQLLERSIEWAKEHKGRKIYVDVSALDSYEGARNFYAKHGFEEEGRLIEFYDRGEDMIIMGRKL